MSKRNPYSKQRKQHHSDDGDHGPLKATNSRFYLSPMEVVPLTPGNEGRKNNYQRNSQERQVNNSGWSSSMALFSYSDSNANSETIHSLTTRSNLSNPSPPTRNLSESSSFQRSRTYSQYSGNNSDNRMYDTTFREATIDRTTSQPKSFSQGFSQDNNQRFQPPTSLKTSMAFTSQSKPNVSPYNNSNPWLPPIESLTTPSSVASSTTSSAFVFGQRRPSLRSEISRLDSAASPSHHSIQSSRFHTNRLLGASSESEDESCHDDSETVLHLADENVEVSLEDTPIAKKSGESYDEEHGLSPSHLQHFHQVDDQHENRKQGQNNQEQPWIRQTRHWTRQASEELARVGEITGQGLLQVGGRAGTELKHLTRYAISAASCTTARVLGREPVNSLSPIMESARQDLHELQKTHQDRMDRLKACQIQDHYEFALVLTPQMSYAFWAERLDFRAEQLGELLTSVPSSNDSTVESQDDDEGENDKENSVRDENHANFEAKTFSTPQTGLRRRHNSTSVPASPAIRSTACTPVSSHAQKSQPKTSERKLIWSNGFPDSEPRVVKPRLSLFEKALGSPIASRTSSGGFSTMRLGPESSNTPSTHGGYDSGVPSTNRRRWGNRPDLTTTPLASFTSRKRLSTSVRKSSEPDGDEEQTRKRCRMLEGQDFFPSQVIPRGIAARSNGMIPFLAALKRGVVVRRHRPGAVAAFVRLFSNDGGDTIKMEPISNEEAILAFREQRVRFNRKMAKRRPGFQVQSQRWAHIEEDAQAQNFELPDFIAAEQYRKKLFDKNRDLKTFAVDTATRLKNSGSIRIQDVIDVHPGRHEDPRAKGELGTAHLRRSKSEYDPNYSFSIVQRAKGVGGSKRNAATAAERWRSGEGNAAQFKTVDFEAASEGEYWLVFRGFLLLHRDAARGRFASNRMTGFGSNYREELASDVEQNRLQADTYHEPKTFSWFERRIADLRKIDITLESTGSAEPGAVPPPSDYFLGFKSPGTQIWSRLRQAGLETARIYAIDTRRVMIKVRCPVDRLTDVAEVLRIKLKKRDGKFAPFRESNLGTFAPIHDELEAPEGFSLFRSCHRQKVIDFIIRSRIRDSGAELGQNTDLGKMIQARVPLHMPKKLDSLYRVWLYFFLSENWKHRDGRSMSVGPTDPLGNDLDQGHWSRYSNDDRVIPNPFSRFLIGAFHQPLDSIEQYFGEQVTFYFAWLQHCSHHLIFLSIVGCIVSVLQFTSKNWDHPIRPFFAVVVMLWSFQVLVKWRQRSSFLAHRWGTMDHKEQETTRPQFKGEYRQDEITGEWVVYYPPWKRYIKYAVSFPITLLFTTGTLILILLVHANRDLMLAQYAEQNQSQTPGEFTLNFRISAIGAVKPIHSVKISSIDTRDPKFWFIIAGLPSLLGLFLPLLNFILMRISVMLNDFENYRTESHYRTALIVKVFSFRFVCYFATLYYYAFLSVGDSQAIENGILRVGSGVFIYTTVAYYWGLFIQIYFPIFLYQIGRRRQKKRLHEELMQVEQEEKELEDLNDDGMNDEEIEQRKVILINKRLLLDQAQDDLWRETMLPEHDSFPEYIQAVVQFAYVTCFSVVLPITPLICLMNQLISMRLDAYKLCKTRRRPLAQTTGGIGVWEHVLHIVSVIAILTNCWLMGFTNAQVYSLSTSVSEIGLFAIVVIWEHLMLLIKYIMQASTHKLPKSVRDMMAKEQYEQEQKRNWSLRHKKDRRSSRARDLVSPGVNSLGSVDSESRKQTASCTDATGRLESGSNGRLGLMTIPSEDISECSSKGIDSRNAESMKGRLPLQGIENQDSGMHQSERVSNDSRGNGNMRSHVMNMPTPNNLASSLDEEKGSVFSPQQQDQNLLNNRVSWVSSTRSSSMGTTDNESQKARSVVTVPSQLRRYPARLSDESQHTTGSSVATVPSKLASMLPHEKSSSNEDAIDSAYTWMKSYRLPPRSCRMPYTPTGELHEA